MHVRRPRPAPPSWLRLPRRTSRLRLTALYGGLFLISGAAVLTITYLLTRSADKPKNIELSGHVIRVIPHPAAGELGLLQAAVADQTARDLNHLLIRSGLALVIMAVLALILGWLMAGRVLRPLSTITATARRISANQLSERLDLQGPDDEFKDLGDTLDDLFGRLEASFESQRNFVANAAHELRTPLTAERTLLQVALDDPMTTADVWRSTSEEVLASNAEQERLIEALLTLASSQGGIDHREPVELPVVASGLLSAPRPEIDRLRLHVAATLQTATIDGDPLLIERLTANLIDNAVRYNVAGGRVEISTGIQGGRAVLSVANSGPVIPPPEVDRLFQPFQRLDGRRTQSNDGHGLGLSIVQAIAGVHGAIVAAQAPPGGGLIINVTFPSAAHPKAAPDERRGLSDRARDEIQLAPAHHK
jgi:signal transduction histidine kinase